MTDINRSRPFDEYRQEQLRNPEFAAIFYALEPEFQIARQVLRLRLIHGLSQAELAKRVGTAQPNLSRLERATINPSLSFLQRVATALNAEIEIHFNPVEDSTDSLTSPSITQNSLPIRSPSA